MERRTVPRVSLLAPAVFSFDKNAGVYWGHFRDLSTRGAKLVSRTSLTSGDRIHIDVTLPGDDFLISHPAKIVWLRHAGAYRIYGVSFADDTAGGTILGALKTLLRVQKEEYRRQGET